MDNSPDEYQSTPQSKSAIDSGALNHWFIKPKSMILAMIGLFLVFMGIAFFLGYQHLDTTRQRTKIDDKTAATLLADVLSGHAQTAIGLLQSYASRPLFITAVKQKNVANAHRHLAQLKKHHNIDLTFVTDPKGVLWLNYPFYPEAMGKDLSYRDWYRGVSSRWMPYASEVFQLIVADKPLAVAICVPVFDERGKAIGILANSQRLEFLVNAIERIPFSPHTGVTIVDRTGDILYSNRYAYRETITKYQHSPMLDQAIAGKHQQVKDTRHKDVGTLYLTMVPVGDIGWTVVIERKLADIYRSELRRFAEIGAAALLLFILSGFALVHMRRVALFRKTKELLEAREAALESEARFRNLFENALEGVYQSTPEGRLISVNMAFARMFGYESPEEAIETITDMGRQMYVNPDDGKRAVGLFRERGYVKDFECRMRRRDGRTFWAHFNGRLSKTPDGFQHFDGFILDITERKQAEEALAIQARIATIFLTITDDETFNEILKVILDIMGSPFGVFGYIDEAGALTVPTMTRQIWDKCQVSDKTIVFPHAIWGDSSWPRAIREKKANYSNEVSTKTPVGHVPVTRHISVPILLQDEVIGLFQVANKETDYTEADVRTLETIAVQVAPLLSARLQREWAQAALGKLNEELEQRVLDRTAQLESANKELEAFSYSVSHDLRAPLRAIDGYVRILLEDFGQSLDAEGKRICSVISESARSMGKLIDDLLAFSRIGRAALVFSPIDMEDLANSIFRELTTPEDRERIDFNVSHLPPALGDPNLIRQVWINFLENAVKFSSRKGRAVIEVSSKQTDTDVVYSIRDNGVGFDMQYADKLFGVFQRLHSTRDFEGTGVGLAIVQRIILRHGGRVWAEGEMDKGAMIHFSLKKGEKS